MKSESKISPLHGKILPALAAGTFHSMGVLFISAILLIPFVSRDIWSLYWEATSHTSFLSSTIFDVLLHIGLSACLWTLGYILFRLWTLQKRSALQTFRATRGAVLVETLIVLVPFLLLTSGIAQLTILNITGVLAHLASYQATRTAWVWQPEADKGRKGVNNAQVDRRARVAAAAVMAPVAPSDYFVAGSGLSNELIDLRGTMTGAFSPDFSNASGSHGKHLANAMLIGGKSSDSKNLTYTQAFDHSSFPARAARKLTFAYAATDVKVQRGNTITTTLTYRQNIVFPWFSYIWGTPGTVAGRTGYYVTLTRSFSMPAQVRL